MRSRWIWVFINFENPPAIAYSVLLWHRENHPKREKKKEKKRKRELAALMRAPHNNIHKNKYIQVKNIGVRLVVAQVLDDRSWDEN